MVIIKINECKEKRQTGDGRSETSEVKGETWEGVTEKGEGKQETEIR